MNPPSDWPLVVVAGAAAAVAIVGGNYLPVALPAGVVALALAGLLFVGAGARRSRREGAALVLPSPTAMSTLRAALRAGRSGRTSIVGEIDRIERRVARPELPARPPETDLALQRMSPSEFRAYLRERLDALEAEAG